MTEDRQGPIWASTETGPGASLVWRVGALVVCGVAGLAGMGTLLGLGGGTLLRLGLAGVVVLSVTGWQVGRWLHRSHLERRRAERRLAVQYTTARLLAEAPSRGEAVPKILQAICESLGWPVGAMWQVDTRSNAINCVEFWHAQNARVQEFEAASRDASMPPGVGLPGRVWAAGRPAWIRDLAADDNFPRAPYAVKVGLHSGLGFPVRRGQRVLGVMEFFSDAIQAPDADLLEMLGSIGHQVGQFIERQRMEAALQDSEALYHSLVDTLPINVLRKDVAGRVTFGNRLYCEVLGRSLEELRGKTDFDLFPRELAEKYVADDRRVIDSRQVFEGIEQHRKPDGAELYVHVLKAPVFDAHGGVVGTQTIFWDETARQQAEETLRRTAAELARSNRELEQFAYVASHDLQEPLRMVASFTQLLTRRYEDKLDADGKEFIHFAVDGAVRMQGLINDLLAYSRVGTRGRPFARTDCGEVLRQTLAEMQAALEEGGATVTQDPLPVVMADAVQLGQLFQNLLSNALKFRRAEPPRIHVGAAAQDGAWVFNVRDNGLGIEPQYFERIFAIFQRLHTRDQYPGTGIGLALCKRIVERHGGRIWVESGGGQGSTFHFSIPTHPAPAR